VASRARHEYDRQRVVGIISAIGRNAGVVVNKADGKFASAHDLRRSFATRWSKRVMPAVLQRLMRHAEIATTMKYYVTMDADEVADGLWGKDWDFGNTLGNNRPHDAKKDETAPAEASTEAVEMKEVTSAEGTGFEPATGFPAPHFQCGR